MATYIIRKNVGDAVISQTYTSNTTFEQIYEEIEGLDRIGNAYFIQDIQLTPYVVNLYKTNICSRNAIINFFNWLSLNPKKEIYNNILFFIERWNLEITTNGFLVLFRNVVKLEDGTYTDNHTKTMKYELGSSAKLNDEDVDWNSDNTCSRGLHAGARDWMNQGYFGDTAIKVFINPMHIAACPPRDNYGKLRATEIFFAEEVQYDNGKIKDGYSLVHDNDYNTISFFELSEKLGRNVRHFIDLNDNNKSTMLSLIEEYIDRDYAEYDYCSDDETHDCEYDNYDYNDEGYSY